MRVKIAIDGQDWIDLEVKDTVAPAVLKELHDLYQTIITGEKKSFVTRQAVHQLRKKYG